MELYLVTLLHNCASFLLVKRKEIPSSYTSVPHSDQYVHVANFIFSLESTQPTTDVHITNMAEFVFNLKCLQLGYNFYQVHFTPIYYFMLQYFCALNILPFISADRSILVDRNMLSTHLSSSHKFICCNDQRFPTQYILWK